MTGNVVRGAFGGEEDGPPAWMIEADEEFYGSDQSAGDPAQSKRQPKKQPSRGPSGQGPVDYNRKPILIRAGELHVMATEAEAALIAADTQFFVRGGIVRPVIDELPASHGRRTKVARLLPIDANMLVDHLSRSAQFAKFNARKKDWLPSDPPLNVAATILAREGEWKFRPLSGVITAPTLRPDGSVLSKAGYDPATRLLLLDPPMLPFMPDLPTRADAIAALDKIDRLLDGFPFIDDASRSVALSAMITPVVRGAMPVAPLHATSAPAPGSGKSYLIDIASTILTGDRAPVLAAGRNEEETEKRLGAALLAGQPIVSIDNVNGELGGDSLCQMVERPVVSIRPLGASKLIRIESRASIFATGNNIRLVGDMTRRTLLCSLDPNLERPELRTFESDPLESVQADRGAYIAAALIIVRAYMLADCPGQLPALASFETWSMMVRSALVWLGRVDPIKTMEAARAEDPELTRLGGVMKTWHEAVGSSSYTSGGIAALTDTRDPHGRLIYPDLITALAEVADNKRGGVDTRRLGHFLGKFSNRIVDGLRIVADTDTHNSQKLWKVVRVSAG